MINTIIVDDEHFCCEVLLLLLKKYCPQVQVITVCHSGEEALKAIQQYQPHLVFLDVEMPDMNGFEMLEQLPAINFDLVFTTSYDQYAMKAIHFSAIDYLLKPINSEELQKAVQKAASRPQKELSQQLEILLAKVKSTPNNRNKVAMPTLDGLQMITIDTIVSCQSDSNYTILLLKEKQKMTVSRTLKEIEELLDDYSFIRVHHSYVVNLNEIVKYVKGEGGYLIMSDGSHIDVSRSRKEALLKKLLNNKQ